VHWMKLRGRDCQVDGPRVKRRGSRRLAVASAAALLLAGLAVAGGAVGAAGGLGYDGCVSNDGSGGSCADVPGTPLSGPGGMALSPDSKSLYVASAGSGTITHFFAAANGQISYDGCVSNDGSGGACADAPGSPLTAAEAVAVSPGGGSVYVASAGSGTITHFFAAPGGQLTYDGCISNDGSGGLCAAASGSPLSGADAVAVSPDGRSVYVGSATSGTITHFFAAPGGQLTYDGCVSNGGSGGACAAASGDALTDVTSVAVSPDGKSVYATAGEPAAVSHFFAAPGGQLTYDGCVSNDGSGGACANAPGSPLGDATSVAVSPDGSSVYVASPAASTLSTFAVAIASGGQLSYSGCISVGGSDGLCTNAAGTSLQGVTRVVVSPNGNSVYTGSYSGDAITHFFRSGGTSGTAAPVLSSLTIQPSAFRAAAGGPTVVVTPSSRLGAKVSYQLSAAASVSFVVTHSVAGRRQKVNGGTRCVAPTRRNAHAGTCVRVLTVGSFTQAGAAGANSFRFSGRINGARLPVGSGYALIATPAAGKPVKATFRIKGA
jgi:DNA-binding beta-propeller fold protein YncE